MSPLAEAWPTIVDRARECANWVIATDFDGTLVPLSDHPSRVALTVDARALLTRLATRSGVTVAVASGRQLADLDRHIGVPNAVLVASHGYEVRLPGQPIRAEARPADLSAARLMLEALEASPLVAVPGLRMEDKGPILALDLRLVDTARRTAVKQAVRALLASSGEFAVIDGRESLEIRPRRPVHKGSALRDALRGIGSSSDTLWWYFGDDASDEDVFRTLPASSVTVFVGADGASSAARFTVDDPDVVLAVLSALDEVAEVRMPRPTADCRRISDRSDLL